jgi:dTDP-L-rhamnose 4-epimerase
MVRILVTGAAGFIGARVVPALRVAGHEVVALDALHPAAHHERQMPEGVLFGDVRDRVIVASAMRGVDAVVHQAAMVGMGVDLDDMTEYVACNDLGTATLLATMARMGVRRLVLASSMVVYGDGGYQCPKHGLVRPSPRRHEDLKSGQFEPRCPRCRGVLSWCRVDEDAPLEPRSVYAATKVAQEHLTGAWARETGSAAIALRYHNVYGPGMPRNTPYAGVAAIFRSALERGEAVHVFEDGGQMRDFVHVDDVARANVVAVESLFQGGVDMRAYNIASGEPHTIADMAHALSAAYDGPAPRVTGDFRLGDVRHIVASPDRATSELGFAARTSFHNGMTQFAAAPLRA